MTKIARNQADFVLLLFISFYCVPEVPPARFRRKSGVGTRVRKRVKMETLEADSGDGDQHRDSFDPRSKKLVEFGRIRRQLEFAVRIRQSGMELR